MTAPHLTFFCELPDDQLARTFADPEVIQPLLALGARISLAVTNLSAVRSAESSSNHDKSRICHRRSS